MTPTSSRPVANTVGDLQERVAELQEKLAKAEDQVATRFIQIIEQQRKIYAKEASAHHSLVYRERAFAMVEVRDAIRKEFKLPKDGK